MQLSRILDTIIEDCQLHARWLNTLSLLENTGARKISASEDAETVNLIILKHAAEEHRHAYYLKKQIEKIRPGSCPTYSRQFLLAPETSSYYLQQLDVQVSRYLKRELSLTGSRLRFAAYLLVTYAIELRADELYPVYQAALDKAGCKVNVRSIIVEEKGHLEEMIAQLKEFSEDWERHAQHAVSVESGLFELWLLSLAEAVKVPV